MKKTNEIINDWKNQLSKVGVITFNIQIDTSDFNQVVKEIEELQEENELRKEVMQDNGLMLRKDYEKQRAEGN